MYLPSYWFPNHYDIYSFCQTNYCLKKYYNMFFSMQWKWNDADELQKLQKNT